ncbi:Uncharacterized protein OBRU01_11183, partial [Operophtera brumata]
MSPFMRRNAPEVKANLGPGSYDDDRDAFYDLTHRVKANLGPGSYDSDRDAFYDLTQGRRNASEVKANLGPGSYDSDRDAFYDLTHRHYSTVGLGPRSPRWTVKHEYQPPLRKPSRMDKVPQNCAPFNQTSKRKGLYASNDYPAIFLCRKHYSRLFKTCLSKFQGAKLADFT